VRGWNRAEWWHWERADVREDLIAQKACRQGRETERAPSVAGCGAERCTSSASWYQGVVDEALGTTERSRVLGAVDDEATGLVGLAGSSEECGNMEEKREPVQVPLICLARSPFTDWAVRHPGPVGTIGQR